MHLGPRAIALAVTLNKHHGLTMRRTCKILRELAGLDLTAGGLSQMIDRLADRVEGDYEGLVNQIRGSPAVHADETSWWVGGPGFTRGYTPPPPWGEKRRLGLGDKAVLAWPCVTVGRTKDRTCSRKREQGTRRIERIGRTKYPTFVWRATVRLSGIAVSPVERLTVEASLHAQR